MRFLGLELEDAIPTPRLVALSRGAGQGGRVEELFDLFDGFLKNKAISPGAADHRRDDRVGTKQHNSRETTRRSRKAKRRTTGIQAGQEPPEGQGRALDEEA